DCLFCCAGSFEISACFSGSCARSHSARLSHAVRSMELLDRLFDIARRRNRKIVLPEGDDARIVAAAARLKAERIGQPVLLGASDTLRAIANEQKISLNGIEVIDPRGDARLQNYASALVQARDSMTPAMATR